MDEYVFVFQELDKVQVLNLIKSIMNAKQRKDNLETIRYEKTAWKGYSNVNQEMNHENYYKINVQTHFDLNCDSKLMDRLFWQRVHDHFTTHKIYTINFNTYAIHQVIFPVNTSAIMELSEGKKIIKESWFSYIRHIDGVTRLKVYNCSNNTRLKNVVHRGSQVNVEIPNDCLILFIGDNLHAGVSTF